MSAHTRSLALPSGRLVRAEILKLRKRRGLVVTAALLTVGAAILIYGILVLLHAVNAEHHGPAGGVTNLGNGVGVLSLLGAVAGTLIGASAGAGDLNAGVFRELVATGRSRTALFLARVPGGLTVLTSLVGFAFAVAAAASVAFAGSRPAPSAGLLVTSGLWLLLSSTFYFTLALGLASLVGSRSTTIAVLLAWRLAVTPILLSIPFLGVGREAVPGAALDRLVPSSIADQARQGPNLGMSSAAAVLVIVLWAVVSLALGAWRTTKRDA